MSNATIKTTVVLVATGEKTQIFRSVDAVPARVRQRILSTAERGNSVTILIADRRGKQELLRSIRGLPSSVKVRASQKIRRKLLRRTLLQTDWIDVVLAAAACGLLSIAAFLA